MLISEKYSEHKFQNKGVLGLRKMKMIFLALAMGIMIGSVIHAEEGDTPVAVGDGFKITNKDVGEVIKFFESVFKSTDKEYVQATIRLWLFAKEARALGLGKDSDTGEDSVKQYNELQKLYIDKLMKDYPVSDLAIESYYWAHPQYFFIPEESKTELKFKPLDAEAKEKIRDEIVRAKNAEIWWKAAEYLKQKYHLKLCDNKGACQ